MVNISIQKEAPKSVILSRRHEERSLTMTRDDIIECLTRLNMMNKALNKNAENLVESPDKLREKTIEELRELYIEITSIML